MITKHQSEINMLAFKRMDVAYDGSTWHRAEPIDINEIPHAIEDMDDRLSKSNPKYDPQSDSFWLIPKADQDDVDNGGKIKMVLERELVEFDSSDTTEETVFPSLFDEHIAMRAAYKRLMVKKSDNGSLLSRLENQMKRGDELIKNHYGKRMRDKSYQASSSINQFF